MKAGDYKQRIVIERRTAAGLNTWSTVATVWAAIEPMSGNQFYQNLVATTEVTGRVRIRYRTDVKPDYRLKFGTRIFNIVGIVNPKEDNRELQIMYQEQI